MRKGTLIISLILIVAITAILIVRQNFKNSPEYNFITAKLDIKNGNARIVHTGFRKTSSNDSEIDNVASKYGFKNIYIGGKTTKQIISGINKYNEVIETYLKVRNGSNWRKKYQSEVDSLYKAASAQNN
jgi:hypothetical protein